MLELINYLRAVSEQYPCGIPRIVPSTSIKKSAGEIVFLTLAKPTQAERELLVAAATKGLGLLQDRFHLEDVEAFKNSPKSFDYLVLCGHAVQQVLFEGDNVVQLGNWRKFKSSQCLVTFEPSQVLASLDTKREFWKYLKMLGSKLRATDSN